MCTASDLEATAPAVRGAIVNLVGWELLLKVQELAVHRSSSEPTRQLPRGKSLRLSQLYLGQFLGHPGIPHELRNAPSLECCSCRQSQDLLALPLLPPLQDTGV